MKSREKEENGILSSVIGDLWPVEVRFPLICFTPILPSEGFLLVLPSPSHNYEFESRYEII